MLDHPETVIPFFTQDGPKYGSLLLKLLFPALKTRMQQKMLINEQSAKNSKETMSIAIERLYQQLQQSPFLVGEQFTRADLAAASLLAPMCMPKKYGLDWPEQLPEQLETLIAEFHTKTQWVNKVYADFR